MAPLGFFDPLGFAKMGDEEGFNNLRAAEIKHGRVAMMAALGAVVQHLVKFPGFEKVPAGLSAVTSAPGTYGFIALLALGAGFELAIWKQDPAKEPGNFGNPVGWGSYDDDMRNKEINNGRFAMFAALGIIAADLVTGKDALQQLGA
jgi:light-harvesting complex I chlorophyll a/b binding protein 1